MDYYQQERRNQGLGRAAKRNRQAEGEDGVKRGDGHGGGAAAAAAGVRKGALMRQVVKFVSWEAVSRS